MRSSVSASPRRTCPLTHSQACCRASRVRVYAIPELYLAAKLAFLPWNGCAVPGSAYSTGVQGTPGIDCQRVYTPAAEAERRAVERLKAQALQVARPPSESSLAREETAVSRSQQQDGVSQQAPSYWGHPRPRAPGPLQQTRSAPETAAPSPPGGSAPAVTEAAAASGSPSKADSADTAAPGEGFVDPLAVRSSLAEGLQERNRQLVEAAWQSLE